MKLPTVYTVYHLWPHGRKMHLLPQEPNLSCDQVMDPLGVHMIWGAQDSLTPHLVTFLLTNSPTPPQLFHPSQLEISYKLFSHSICSSKLLCIRSWFLWGWVSVYIIIGPSIDEVCRSSLLGGRHCTLVLGLKEPIPHINRWRVVSSEAFLAISCMPTYLTRHKVPIIVI
jgi:hypothetical protein